MPALTHGRVRNGLNSYSTDKEAKRISLSYKETLDNPWTKVMDSVGQKVKIMERAQRKKLVFLNNRNGLRTLEVLQI